MIIAIDFDGTIVKDEFPLIGKLLPGAKENLLKLRKEGYYLILWTCRTEKRLAEAAKFLAENGIHFDAYNNSCPANVEEFSGLDTRKVFANMYIDDKGLLKPLPHWDELYELIHERLPTHADKIENEGFL